MTTFCVADIHGNFKALKQCLERSNFDYKKDKLICLGDTCDGFPDVKECFDELLKIKHLVYILGNHDEWALEWYDRDKMYYGNPYVKPESLWTSQGGKATLMSYGWTGYHGDEYKEMDEAHVKLLKSAVYYYIEGKNIFTHGGILETKPVEETHKDVFLWDRDIFARAWNVAHYNPKFKIQHWDSIFIGHTSTQNYSNELKPLFLCNVINLDTGAGWSGKLTIMDVDSKEYWQSDLAQELYPDAKGRR